MNDFLPKKCSQCQLFGHSSYYKMNENKHRRRKVRRRVKTRWIPIITSFFQCISLYGFFLYSFGMAFMALGLVETLADLVLILR